MRLRIGAGFALLVLTLAACAQPAPPKQIEAQLKAALDAAKRGDFYEAVRIDTQALARSDLTPIQRANFLQMRGAMYGVLSKPDLALADDDESLRLNPNNSSVYANRGYAYEQLGRLDDELVDRDKAIGLAPNNTDNFAARAGTYSRMGDYDAGLKDANEALLLKKDNPTALYIRGQIYFAQGRFDDAAADLDQSVQLRPTDPWGVLWLHLARLKMGSNDDAEFNRNLRPINRGKWPMPLLDLYLGQSKPDQVQSAIASDLTLASRPPTCIADLFIGEYELWSGAREMARDFLEKAATACDRNAYLRDSALRDLKQLRPSKPS